MGHQGARRVAQMLPWPPRPAISTAARRNLNGDGPCPIHGTKFCCMLRAVGLHPGGTPAPRRAGIGKNNRADEAAPPPAMHCGDHHPDDIAMEIDKSIRVLVAEDNPNLRKLLVNIVSKIGFSAVVEADSGISAWDSVKEDDIGLVLTDWSMPGMSGLELVAKIRGAGSPTSDIPVLMITAMDTKNSILSAGKQGVDAYIIKPFSVQTIEEKIEEAVRKRTGA